MENQANNRLDLFIENVQTIRKEFFFQDDSAKRLAALIYADAGKKIDRDAIQKAYDLIKQNTSIISSFRGNMAMCLSAYLSLSDKPQQMIDNSLQAYQQLRDQKLHVSDYLVVAAYQIAAQVESSEFERIAGRTRAFYDGMKAHHFFYTGTDDYIFAAMLALSDLDVDENVERIEVLFNRLKGEFWDKNSVQTLAQVMVLGSLDDEAVDKVLMLRDAMRNEGIKLDKTYTLPVLGILAMLPQPVDELVKRIDETKETLRGEKGFGFFLVTGQELLLFAASIVASDCVHDQDMVNANVTNSIASLIIAEQAAMIAMMAATSAASSSSSSSSST